MFAPTGESGQVHMANKIFPIFLNAGIWLFLLLNLRFVTFYEVKRIRKKWIPHGRISKIFFLDHFSPSFLGQKL
jgi:hypothetical protein